MIAGELDRSVREIERKISVILESKLKSRVHANVCPGYADSRGLLIPLVDRLT